MRKLIAVFSVLAVVLVAAVAYAQTRCGSNLCIGSASTAVLVKGEMEIDGSKTAGSCTLDGASPSVCTATVRSGVDCTCSIRGATAAIAAKGCAVSVSSTTLTITSANGATEVVSYTCF